MSRLAVYPLAGSAVFFFGRKSVSTTHLTAGMAIALLPAISLLWSTSATGGIPFAVRWFSFGLMITGFSGTVARWGLRSHLTGLIAAAAAASIVMLMTDPDTLTGNANRAGMILSLGFVGSLILFKKDKWYSWTASVVITGGVFISSFYIGWIACLAGAIVYFLAGRWKIRSWMVLGIMIAGQILFAMLPQFAGRVGPTLELRTRIWRCSAALFFDNLPLGTGTGSARLRIFNSAEPELRELAGGDKRIDYLHSEPLTMITETGLPGLFLLLFMLYWLSRRCKSAEQIALLAAFWPIFTSDLPLATPLGAIPAALFLGSIPSLKNKRTGIPAAVPAAALIFSLYWFFAVVTGYSALGGNGSVKELELACNRIPWEERAFLASGHAHLQNDMVISALEDSRHFIELYPEYYRGWELRAAALTAAGQNNCSAWTRAALLVPENLQSSDKFLFALNAIQPGGMNPDTAVAISKVLTRTRTSVPELIGGMRPAEALFVSRKIMYLSEQCRPLSIYYAARAWLMSAGFAVCAEGEIPADLSMAILRASDLYPCLDSDWCIKADEYLNHLRNELGMEPVQIPSH